MKFIEILNRRQTLDGQMCTRFSMLCDEFGILPSKLLAVDCFDSAAKLFLGRPAGDFAQFRFSRELNVRGAKLHKKLCFDGAISASAVDFLFKIVFVSSFWRRRYQIIYLMRVVHKGQLCHSKSKSDQNEYYVCTVESHD